MSVCRTVFINKSKSTSDCNILMCSLVLFWFTLDKIVKEHNKDISMLTIYQFWNRYFIFLIAFGYFHCLILIYYKINLNFLTIW
jgi:TRAP-type C4-dicarboxylate transport system permease small subunit